MTEKAQKHGAHPLLCPFLPSNRPVLLSDKHGDKLGGKPGGKIGKHLSTNRGGWVRACKQPLPTRRVP